MRRARVLVWGAVCLFVGGSAAARVTQPDVDVTVLPDVPQAPAELTAWVAAAEAQVPDITPGADKHIAWADPAAPARTDLSLVYLHGYSATRQEVAPLCDEVAAALGANVFYTRLEGHGQPGAHLAQATVQDWVEDGMEALAIGHALGETVVVVGTSTGGTLAAWLLANGADADALVLISPNFWPNAGGAGMLLMPGRRVLTRLVVGKEREWTPHNEQQAVYWTWKYPATALFPMMELVKLAERADLTVITQPAMLIYSPDDQVVQGPLAAERFAALPHPANRVIAVTDAEDPSQHVLAGDILSPAKTTPLAEEIAGFLRGL